MPCVFKALEMTWRSAVEGGHLELRSGLGMVDDFALRRVRSTGEVRRLLIGMRTFLRLDPAKELLPRTLR